MPYSIPAVKGLVGQLADYILDSSVREYPQFAIAAAMQIVATCAQGTYTLPDGRPLCLYQLILAPASSGKGAYIGATKRVILEVAEQLLSTEPGSREGLRHGLQEWNARAVVVDEIQDFFAKLGSDNPHISGIGTDLKEIWSGVDKLQSIATKGFISESIRNPFISFMGAGTIKETAQHFGGATTGGGLFSRFQVFFADAVVSAKRHTKRGEIGAMCEQLRKVWKAGQTEDWKGRSVAHWNDYRQNLLQPPNKREIVAPQVRPKYGMKISKEADDLLWEHRRHWEQELLTDSESVAGAVFDRAATAALIYASCHALGCKRDDIAREDINVGLELAGVSAENAIKLATEYAATSEEENDAKKIMRALDKHGPMDKRTLSRMSHLYGKRFITALTGLEQSHNVIFTSSKFQKV